MKNFKNAVLSGVLYGIAMGAFFALFFSVMFIIKMVIEKGTQGILLGILFGLIVGVICGIASAILFGILIGIFGAKQAKKFEPVKESLSLSYTIFYEGGANHFVGKEGVGGWLFLTSQGLYFQSHSFNLQNHELWIHYENIKSVGTYKNLGFLHNGLCIEDNNGNIEKFVVNDAKKWEEEMKKMYRENK